MSYEFCIARRSTASVRRAGVGVWDWGVGRLLFRGKGFDCFPHFVGYELIAFVIEVNTVRCQDAGLLVFHVVLLVVIQKCFTEINQWKSILLCDVPNDSAVAVQIAVELIAEISSFADRGGCA